MEEEGIQETSNERTFKERASLLLKRLNALFLAHWHGIFAILAPIVFCPLLGRAKSYDVVYVTAVMAILWATDAIPAPITSLLPIIALPVLGVMRTETVCKLYFRQTLVIFASCFSSALRSSGLHIRMGLWMLKHVGCSPRRLHVCFCLFTMILSFWISNSAATLMVLSGMDTVLEDLSEMGICSMYHPLDSELPKDERRPSNMKTCFYLSVAYSATIGGCGTLVGTPTTNSIKLIYKDTFPKTESKLTFVTYLIYAMPMVLVAMFFMILEMQFVFMGLFRPGTDDAVAAKVEDFEVERGRKWIWAQHKSLGRMTTTEITVIIMFIILNLALLLKKPPFMPGWSDFYPEDYTHNSVPLAAMLILMFILPQNYKFLKFWSEESLEETPSVLTWEFVAKRAPWGLVFMIGSGIALGHASRIAKTSDLCSTAITYIRPLPNYITNLILICSLVVLTNFITNVAVANITMHAITNLAPSLEAHPLHVVLPCGLACSMAFILPVGTPVNGLVQSYANIETKDMMIGGVLPTLSTIIVIWVMSETWGMFVDPSQALFPEWANYIIDVDDDYMD